MRPTSILVTFVTLAVMAAACSDDTANNSSAPQDAGDGEVGVGADVGSDDGADAAVEVDVDPCDVPPEGPLADPQIHTPRWAFEPWISKDISDRDDTYDFVDGFIDRDIPVGVVVLDSPWETNYNTFVPNPERYPEFEQMVDDMADREVRIVLWVTQMVNESSFDVERGGDLYPDPSPNFVTGKACGFLIEDSRTFFWWKGLGAGVDFFNPRARTWWHRQQDALLEMGIAGWKLDFGEQYLPLGELETAQGPVSHQAYSERYYQDFYAYGASKVGTENFVTMVRAWDASYEWEGRFFARPEHAPVVWAGDNKRDWDGLIDALDHIFRSAAAGYVVVGSDIGGYLDVDDLDLSGPVIPFDQDNFVRWTAVGAMTPFMQLHGRGNLAPWTVASRAEETTAAYRYWSKLHHQMIPFWYSTAEEAYAGEAEPTLRPLGEGPEEWAGDWRYMLGDALLVAPLLDGSGSREVALPAGATWYSWWDPATPLDGGTTVAWEDGLDQKRIPIFARSGAILPLEDVDAVTMLSPPGREELDTVIVWAGEEGTAPSSFVRHDRDDETTTIEQVHGSDGVRVTLSRVPKATQLRIVGPTTASGVEVDGIAIAGDATGFDAAATAYYTEGSTTWVKLPAGGETAVRVLP